MSDRDRKRRRLAFPVFIRVRFISRCCHSRNNFAWRWKMRFSAILTISVKLTPGPGDRRYRWYVGVEQRGSWILGIWNIDNRYREKRKDCVWFICENCNYISIYLYVPLEIVVTISGRSFLRNDPISARNVSTWKRLY